MNFFNFDVKKVALFMTALLIPFLLFKMETKNNEAPFVLKPFSFAAGLVQNAYDSFSSGVRGTTSLYLNLVGISRKNTELTNTNAELRAKLGEMTELQLENERLRKLLEFKQKNDMKLKAARVIAHDLIPEHKTLTINKGTSHGIQKGMAAITVGGVVGNILKADMYTSQIILITDRLAAVDSLVQRSRARGLVEGKDSETCYLNYLKRDDDARIGDLVVTSGLDNVFPKGFPIGTITDVEKSKYGVTQKVELSPIVNANNLEEVFVILDAKFKDFEEVNENPVSTVENQKESKEGS